MVFAPLKKLASQKERLVFQPSCFVRDVRSFLCGVFLRFIDVGKLSYQGYGPGHHHVGATRNGSNAATWDLETLRIWKSNMDIFVEMIGFRLRIFPSYHGGILLAVHVFVLFFGCTETWLYQNYIRLFFGIEWNLPWLQLLWFMCN